jgi:hypothetical protein
MTIAGLRRALPAACVAALCAAAPANAQRCTAPPGTAAVDQYCETVPSVASAQGPSGGSVADAEATRSVPPRTLRQLAAAGAPGRQLSRVLEGSRAAAATRRAHPASRAHARRAPAPARPTRSRAVALAPSRGNPLTAVTAAVAGGERIGSGFPWVLLLIAAGTGATWLRRLRRRR